jgi:hypothetical protein
MTNESQKDDSKNYSETTDSVYKTTSKIGPAKTSFFFNLLVFSLLCYTSWPKEKGLAVKHTLAINIYVF